MNRLHGTLLCLCRTLSAAGARAVLVLSWSRQADTVQLKIPPVNKTLPPGLAQGAGTCLAVAPGWDWHHARELWDSATSSRPALSTSCSAPGDTVAHGIPDGGDRVMAHDSRMPQPAHAELCAGSAAPAAAWGSHTWPVSQVTPGRVWDTGSRSQPHQPHVPGQ